MAAESLAATAPASEGMNRSPEATPAITAERWDNE